MYHSVLQNLDLSQTSKSQSFTEPGRALGSMKAKFLEVQCIGWPRNSLYD